MSPSPSPEVEPDLSPLPTPDQEPGPTLFLPPTSPAYPSPSEPDESSQQHRYTYPADESPSPSGPVDGFGSSPRSTRRAQAAAKRELTKVTAAAVETAGGVAHQILTADGTIERDAGLFLPDQDDVQNISAPLAGLASRRMPEGAENPDVTDLVHLVLAVGAYVVKQLGLRRSLRRSPVGHVDTGDDPGHVPTTADPEAEPEPSGAHDFLSRRQNMSGVIPGIDMPDGLA